MEPQLVQVGPRRCLSYVELGPPAGRPVLFFHGTPGSWPNVEFFADDQLATRHGLRVLAVDRPGIGSSTYSSGWTMTSFAADLDAFCRQLTIDGPASLLAHSCGGPYAFAMAATVPERVRNLVAIASPAPRAEMPAPDQARPSDEFLKLCATRPRLARMILRAMGLTARLAPDRMIAQAATSLPEADRAVLREPRQRAAFVSMLRETLRQGPRGAQHDAALVYGSWGFALGDITAPVSIWHGEEDRNVDVTAADHLHANLSHSTLARLSGEGHISILTGHADAILDLLRGQ